jgi:hypothetical protein
MGLELSGVILEILVICRSAGCVPLVFTVEEAPGDDCADGMGVDEREDDLFSGASLYIFHGGFCIPTHCEGIELTDGTDYALFLTNALIARPYPAPDSPYALPGRTVEVDRCELSILETRVDLDKE